MEIHTKTAEELGDLTKLWCDLRERTSLVSNGGNYVAGQGGFAHVVGGYAAGYYGVST
jgi:Zn-dependent oligopeptidase